MIKFEIRYAAIGLAGLALAGAALVATSDVAMARGRVVPLTDGWADLSASGVREPGGYNSLADFSRSVEGTPCGIDCTRAKAMQQSFPGHF
jgi:hypothetical protein